MFMEAGQVVQQPPGALPDEVADLRARLLALDLDATDREIFQALRGLADLTNTISAVQARLICAADASSGPLTTSLRSRATIAVV